MRDGGAYDAHGWPFGRRVERYHPPQVPSWAKGNRLISEWRNTIKVLFFDTESTALDGDWGRILCASFLELTEEQPYTYRKDLRPCIGRNKIDDSKLVVAVRKEIESADIVIGWNSILHDIPLLNARLAAADERPIRLGEKYGIAHIDLMY